MADVPTSLARVVFSNNTEAWVRLAGPICLLAASLASLCFVSAISSVSRRKQPPPRPPAPTDFTVLQGGGAGRRTDETKGRGNRNNNTYMLEHDA